MPLGYEGGLTSPPGPLSAQLHLPTRRGGASILKNSKFVLLNIEESLFSPNPRFPLPPRGSTLLGHLRGVRRRGRSFGRGVRGRGGSLGEWSQATAVATAVPGGETSWRDSTELSPDPSKL